MNPTADLRGAARSYGSSYTRSFDALLARIEDAGYHLVLMPGPKGGTSSQAVQVYIAEAIDDLSAWWRQCVVRNPTHAQSQLAALVAAGFSIEVSDEVLVALLQHSDRAVREGALRLAGSRTADEQCVDR